MVRKRYTGLYDRKVWVQRTLVPMHRDLLAAQLRCFPFHDEYLAIDKALKGVTECADALVGEDSPFKPRNFC